MSEAANKLISRNRGTSYLLYALCAFFTGILGWGFIMSIQQGLGYKEAIIAMPGQLEAMWFAVVGLICGGHEEEVNKFEKILNIDLDKDGDIGVAGSSSTPSSATANQVAMIPEPVVSTPVTENEAIRSNFCPV